MLSGSYDLDERAENKVYDYHTNRDNLKYTEDYVNKEEEERHLEDANNSKNQTKENNNKLTAIEDFDIPDNVSKSHQRESDLLGINDEVPPKRTLQDDNQRFDFKEGRQNKSHSSINHFDEEEESTHAFRPKKFDEED